MDYRAWNPTAMPRRESEHAFLHPRYDGGPEGQTASGRQSARVVEERMIREEVTLLVDPQEC
jgi:hypothetical protein